MRRIASRILVSTALITLGGLLAIFIYGSLATNRLVAQLTAWPAGTPLADIVAVHGPPDQIDPVNGSWKWGRHAWRVGDDVREVAVYYEAIIPQVCAIHLDATGRVVQIDAFPAYPRGAEDDDSAGTEPVNRK